jgi:hypothetical protein
MEAFFLVGVLITAIVCGATIIVVATMEPEGSGARHVM